MSQGSARRGDGGRGDAVDVILAQWRHERPDLDLSAMGIFGRLTRLSRLISPAVEEASARYGMRHGEFDVLASLRRSGPPYTLTPSELSAALMMSRAGMTNRLDRLERAGLVERTLAPDDRRSVRVTLTRKGRETADAALTEHVASLTLLLSGLTAEERRVLDRTMRVLLRSVGRSAARGRAARSRQTGPAPRPHR
ncbi:MarR family winged helix-turn-helix transcriptional regulator [Streptosporangium saharense]|uniref:MarR family winged helix-turn-helix transcriptional regulator n=1 Tax=Streptosporangium saharense TaxID=1706840 RepID=UPI0036871C77